MRQSREGRAASRAPQAPVDLQTVVVTRTYLALEAPEQLRPKLSMTPFSIRLRPVHQCPVSMYRELYAAVGAEWFWHDRDAWSDEQLAAHLADPNIRLWVAEGQQPKYGGYFELARREDGSVEIAYFGIVRAWFGIGAGGWLITRAAEEAWALGAKRVWLHTCTLDSPRALPNYKARGFVPFRTEQFEATLEGNRIVKQRPL